jgi:hypothetical protein
VTIIGVTITGNSVTVLVIVSVMVWVWVSVSVSGGEATVDIMTTGGRVIVSGGHTINDVTGGNVEVTVVVSVTVSVIVSVIGGLVSVIVMGGSVIVTGGLVVVIVIVTVGVGGQTTALTVVASPKIADIAMVRTQMIRTDKIRKFVFI